MKIFGREPVAVIAGIQALLALFISFGWLEPIGLTTQKDVGIVVATISAGAAVYLAYVTTETLLQPIVEFVKAGLALAAVWNLKLSVDETAYLIAAVTAVIGAWTRGQVSPLVRPTFRYIAPDDVATPKAA